MEKEERQKYLSKSEDEQRFISKGKVPRKEVFRLQIPYNLRYALGWSIFFALIGIVIQSIQAGAFVFKDFFIGNYADWFRSFGTFTSTRAYNTPLDLIYAIMGEWYYFLYTGGLISILWTLIKGLINSEISFTAKQK